MAGTEGVKALFFDVFGTLVDWRTSIAREAAALLAPRGLALDGLDFADAWRAGYQPAMEEVRSGREGFVRLDVLHRRMLDRIAPRFGLEGLPAPLLRDLTLAWHRLDAWPDVAEGLRRLRARFLLAPVSNGNIALMIDLARRNHWHWDAILGAEIARDYKPRPGVYRAAAEALGLDPGQCMMVFAASHWPSDGTGAIAAGLRTAAIARPDEFGPGSAPGEPDGPVDVAAGSLVELAERLGA
jgi:2-haloacid dehalogenase